MTFDIYSNVVGGWATPLKNMTSSIGMMRFPTYGKIKNGNQTTNQVMYGEPMATYGFSTEIPKTSRRWHLGERAWKRKTRSMRADEFRVVPEAACFCLKGYNGGTIDGRCHR